ncbi:MAG: exodeoxyribonuclease VII small subunit [Elstera sp.]
MSDDIAGLSFEDAMAQLEAIVRDLESGKGKLDDAVGAYDRGVRLRRHCDAKLAEAQAKIDKIVAGPDGAVGTEPFDAQS